MKFSNMRKMLKKSVVGMKKGNSPFFLAAKNSVSLYNGSFHDLIEVIQERICRELPLLYYRR